MKKFLTVLLKLIGFLLCFTGNMGIYFSYCFNTKDIELTFLSIKINILGVFLFLLGRYISEKFAFDKVILYKRLIIFILVLGLSLVIFYFNRYPSDILLGICGIIVTSFEILVINGEKNKRWYWMPYYSRVKFTMFLFRNIYIEN